MVAPARSEGRVLGSLMSKGHQEDIHTRPAGGSVALSSLKRLERVQFQEGTVTQPAVTATRLDSETASSAGEAKFPGQ